MEREKMCNNCEKYNEEHSLSWEMIKKMSKTIKRQSIFIVLILCLWFASIVSFAKIVH